ncbi:TIGR00282 family metallophosphoesterase [Phycisphaeraceae bacterium D3-23]
MTLKIAILGDIVGVPGRQAAAAAVPDLREQHGVHLVLANAENAANGSGLTPELYRKLCAAGIDGFTLGDHAFRKQQIYPTLDAEPNIIRPVNLPAKARGRGVMTLDATDDDGRTHRVHVVTLIGQLFMSTMRGSDPYAAADRVVSDLKSKDPNAIVIAEIHAEATSEKVAMGWHLNGRAACVFGTHTHIPTADARLLPTPQDDESIPGKPWLGIGRTAYITDLGMTGPYDSVLGRRADRVVKHMTTSLPAAFDVAEGQGTARGVIVEVDPASGLAVGVESVTIPSQ